MKAVESERLPRLGDSPGRKRVGYLAGIATAGNFVALIMQFAAGLLIARLLSPNDLGTLNSFLLIATYAVVAQVGIINGLNRELPYYLGQGARDKAMDLSSTALGWAISCSCATGFIAAVWVLRALFQESFVMAAGGATLAVVVVCSFPKLYLQATMRTASEFVRLAACQVAVSVLSLFLVVLVWKAKYYGLCARTAAVALVECAMLWRWRPVKAPPQLNLARWRHLFRIGSPIFALGYLEIAWSRLDSVMVVKTLGTTELGLYQLSAIVLSVGGTATTAFAAVIYPRMAETFGRTKDGWAAYRIALPQMMLLGAIAAPLTAIGWFLIPALVPVILPQYTAGVRAAQWTLITVYASCFHIGGDIFNVIRRQDVYGVLIGIGAAVFVVSAIWLKGNSKDPLSSISQAMALSRLLFVIMANCCAFRVTRRSRS